MSNQVKRFKNQNMFICNRFMRVIVAFDDCISDWNQGVKLICRLTVIDRFAWCNIKIGK